MATARITASVRIDLEPGERWQALSLKGEPISDQGDPWMVSAFTLTHPEGEYVRAEVQLEGGRESTLGPIKVTRLPAHVLPLLSSARMTLRVIQQLQAVTTDAVR